jgi:hypothetical protein
MNVYRIIDIGILIKMFKENKIYFASPQNWQDKWEKLDILFKDKHKTYLFNRKRGRIFAQCWTKKGYSWALWKLHSTNGNGVRLKADLSTIYNLMPSDIKTEYKMNDIIRIVDYNKEEEIVDYIKKSSINNNISVDSIKDLFFLKRGAFEFEDEYRIIIPKKRHFTSLTYEKIGDKLFISYPCDPRKYVLSIYFDSNIDQYVYEVFKSILKDLGYNNTIDKSTIDQNPIKIVM